MIKAKHLFLFVASFGLVFSSTGNNSYKTDLVIFSYNRPLQLFSLLESISTYCIGVGEVHIVYRTSNTTYDHAYETIKAQFPATLFHKENDPEEFFNFVTACAFKSPHQYVSFVVDDVIVKDKIDLKECIYQLETTGAYAFFLRLGLNISYCYMQKKEVPIPPGRIIDNCVYEWRYKDGLGDWAFPNNFDMTIYRKKDIEAHIRSLNPKHGIFFENFWNKFAPMNRSGICFKQSKIVNVSINTVCGANMWQFSSYWREKMHEFSPEELLKKFLAGNKIDLTTLHQIDNKAPHIEWIPIFAER